MVCREIYYSYFLMDKILWDSFLITEISTMYFTRGISVLKTLCFNVAGHGTPKWFRNTTTSTEFCINIFLFYWMQNQFFSYFKINLFLNSGVIQWIQHFHNGSATRRKWLNTYIYFINNLYSLYVLTTVLYEIYEEIGW